MTEKFLLKFLVNALHAINQYLKSAICHLVRHHPVDICRTLHTSRSKFSRGNNDDIDDSENDEFESSSYSDLVGSETHGSLQQDYHLDALQIQKVRISNPFMQGNYNKVILEKN